MSSQARATCYHAISGPQLLTGQQLLVNFEPSRKPLWQEPSNHSDILTSRAVRIVHLLARQQSLNASALYHHAFIMSSLFFSSARLVGLDAIVSWPQNQALRIYITVNATRVLVVDVGARTINGQPPGTVGFPSNAPVPSRYQSLSITDTIPRRTAWPGVFLHKEAISPVVGPQSSPPLLAAHHR